METLASFFARLGFFGAILVEGWLLLNIAALFEVGQWLHKRKTATRVFIVLVFPLAALFVFMYTMVAIILGLVDNKKINHEGS